VVFRLHQRGYGHRGSNALPRSTRRRDAGAPRFPPWVNSSNALREVSAFPRQHPGGETREAAAGDAHAQEAADESALEGRIVLERVHNGANFLFRLRGGNAANAIQVAVEKTGPDAIDEQCDGLDFRMHGIPKHAFLEIVLRLGEPGAKCGFEVLSGFHGCDGALGLQNTASGGAVGFNGPGGYGRGCVAAAFLGSRCHADYHGKRGGEMATPFSLR